ncbi:Cathepsin L [Chamberlinius hualienensis]
MKLVLLCLVLLGAHVNAVSFFQVSLEEFKLFTLQHGKTYKDQTEEKFRMKIYNENKHKIAVHNQLFHQGQASFKLAMNQYGDLLHHEFASLMNGFKKTNKTFRQQGSTFLTPANLVLPETVDWRSEGYVTPVKNQGACGSCWAFSATGSLEGQHFKKSGKLVSLSEQNLVDCSSKYGNEGCNGGLMDNAFQYIKDNGGIDTEDSYPYSAKDGQCHYRPDKAGATDTGYVDIDSGSEKKLQEALATVGPISIAIDAGHESFQFYSEGVYYEAHCSSEDLDHGVLVVGYGTEKTGGDFWLVKNSWGEGWGDKGYIKMARNKNNQCGVATQASYPLV